MANSPWSHMRKSGEGVHVDTGCLATYSPSVDFNLVQASVTQTMLTGGEGAFFARLAGWMLPAAGECGGSRGEGSVLDGFGGFIGGMIERRAARARPARCS